ncbi:hypothetical protein DRP44_01805 [candidate division TA06 bacterium]|uniref:Uncharacterized protein n=1 Tax=candidate division TA06 bacterium TaxID=2250710 RepID=A0A660SCG6_UNCT6|nr:MAG: hypothetical protein DRP44_01805 [candidate division TA06 bacterium]
MPQMRTKNIRNFLTINVGDGIIVAILLVFTIASFGMKRGDKENVIVEVNGKLLYKLSASTDTIINATGYKGPFKFQIKEGKVRMLDSTCPLHLCVKEGWIAHAGDMIICVPNRVKISFGGSDYDAVIK